MADFNARETGDAHDVWSTWLLENRHGGDAGYDAWVQQRVAGYAERLLAVARLVPGQTLLDLGSGEGLVPFRALEQMQGQLQVVCTDVSSVMLAHVQNLATERGLAPQCRFVQAGAEDLAGVEDESVDVLTARSVLAYVGNRAAALAEAWRVLKPGGRLSFAEPVFADEAYEICALRVQAQHADASPAGQFLKALHRCKAAQWPDTPAKMAAFPLTNYTERDLLRAVANAGFKDLHMELHIDMLPSPVRAWEVFVRVSPHPWAPTLAQALESECTAEERALLEALLRPQIEAGTHLSVDRMVYIAARKPSP